MQRVNAYIHNIVVGIDQFDGFLRFAFHLNFLQTAKFSNSVIDVRYIIAYGKGVQFLQRNGLLFGIAVFQVEFVVAFKNLMVSIARDLVFFVDETLKQWENDGFVLFAHIFVIRFVQTFKNIMKTFRLSVIGTKQIVFDAVKMVVVQVIQ